MVLGRRAERLLVTWRVKKAHLLKFSSKLKCSLKASNFHALQQQISAKALYFLLLSYGSKNLS